MFLTILRYSLSRCLNNLVDIWSYCFYCIVHPRSPGNELQGVFYVHPCSALQNLHTKSEEERWHVAAQYFKLDFGFGPSTCFEFDRPGLVRRGKGKVESMRRRSVGFVVYGKNHWRSVVNTLWTFGFRYRRGISLIDWQLRKKILLHGICQMFHIKSILIYFGIFDLPDFTCLAATLPYVLLSPKFRCNVISYFRVTLRYTRHIFIFK